MLGPHTITRLRGTPITDPYSGEVTELSWDDPESLVVAGCSVQPVTPAYARAVLRQQRDGVITDYNVWVPLTADVTELDRVEWAGQVYLIPDTIQRWDFPGLGHLVVPIRKVDG